MACLDTNFIIDLIRNDSDALEKLRSLSGEPICTTAISAAELYRGAWKSNDRERETTKIRKILGNMRVISFDDSCAAVYAELYCQLKSNPIKEYDLLIASMTISNDETLLTRDDDFRRVTKLSCDSW
ncbi:MAG: type II toxin-antitoxin system VapC family toxin [Candidatus Nitrosopolaris sp.]